MPDGSHAQRTQSLENTLFATIIRPLVLRARIIATNSVFLLAPIEIIWHVLLILQAPRAQQTHPRALAMRIEGLGP
jgi:hypothetical protein